MKIIHHQEIITIETEKGNWKRVYDIKNNVLSWQNDYKAYTLQPNGQWRRLSLRLSPEIVDKCYLEDEYQEMIRKEKIKRLLKNDE